MRTRERFSRLGVVGALLLLAIAVGCSGTSSSSGDTGGQPQIDGYGPPPDGGSDVVYGDTKPSGDTGPVRNGVLQFVTLSGDDGRSCQGYNHCNMQFDAPETRRLEVRYLEEDAPVSNVLVQFEITDNDHEWGQLQPSTGRAVTGADGVARLDLVLQTTEPTGSFTVEVTVPGGDVLPAYFDVFVIKTINEPLQVCFDYRGGRTLTHYEARLYMRPRDAAATDPSDPASYVSTGLACGDLVPPVRAGEMLGISAYAVSPEVPPNQCAIFVNALFPDLPYDEYEMFTILGIGYDANGTERVLGCNGQDGLLEWGSNKTVVLSMEEIPPRLAGTYEVLSHFDFLSALPSSVQDPVRRVLNFFCDPAGEILSLLCLPEITVTSDLCDYLYNDDGSPSTVGTIVITMINGLIQGFTADSVWGDILGTGCDVSTILTDLQLRSTIEFEENADLNGLISEDSTYEEWTTVRYRWTLGVPGCAANPDCGWEEFSFYAVGTEVVEASFSASVNTVEVDGHAPYTLLTIDPHALNIRYGALINYIIKNVLIPRLAGDGSDGYPRVDTYEELLKVLLAGKECLLDETTGGPACCQTFAEDLVSQVGDIAVTVVRSACDALIPVGSAYFESLLVDLDFDTGDPNAANAFVIGTADGSPCTLVDANDDLYVDALGTATAPCRWDAVLRLNIGGGTEIHVDGTFTGSRQ